MWKNPVYKSTFSNISWGAILQGSTQRDTNFDYNFVPAVDATALASSQVFE